jgi:hypothetical protein
LNLLIINPFKNKKSGWWFGTFSLLFHILGIIIPTDFHIFQRGGSTTNKKAAVALPGAMLRILASWKRMKEPFLQAFTGHGTGRFCL